MTVTEDLQRIFPDQIKRLSARNIALTIGVVTIAVSSLVAIIILASLLSKCRQPDSYQAISSPQALESGSCATPDCLHTAGFVVDNMDISVDPCEDFFKFSCGGYKFRHSLNPDESEVTMEECLEKDVQDKLRNLISNPNDRLPSSSSEEKMRDFFTTCVHDYGRAKEGGKVMVDLIRSTLNGWFVLDPVGWKNNWNFQEALRRVQGELLVNAFFITYLEKDSKTNTNLLSFYNAGYGMSSSIYGNEDKAGTQDAYKDYMRQSATLLIRDSNMTLSTAEIEQRVEQFVTDAFSFESILAAMVQKLRGQRGALYQRIQTTLGQLHNNFTQFDWLSLVQGMFQDLTITGDTQVRMLAPGFFRMVDDLLRNETWGEQKDRMVNNYFAWRIVFKYASDLSSEYRDAKHRFFEAQYGETEAEPTWKVCLRTTMERLGTLLISEFARSHLVADAKQQVNDIFTNIREILADRMSELPWMDSTTKQRATEKMTSTTAMIGAADMYYNGTYMDLLHSELVIDKSEGYFKNLMNVLRFQRRLKTKLVVYKSDAFLEHAPLFGYGFHYWVTPYYMYWTNKLLLPTGVMLDPMFGVNRPQVFNYGYLGSLVGSGMVEVVGRTGRNYWTNNSYAKWWTDDTLNGFNRTASCFVKYFDGLTAGPFRINNDNITVAVNGETQANSLMADLGGIRAGLKAYQKWLKINGPEALPAGLQNRSPEQLYFISAAQTKCFVRTEQLAYENAKMGKLQEDQEINSLLSHLPEFTAAFQCPIGSKMRTTYQCETY